MQVFMPPNLDLKKLLETYPPNFNFQWNIDDFRFIISTIISIKALYKDYHNEEYVPVNAQTLQSRVREYNYYIGYLITHGIIEVKNAGQYKVGERSRSYKLSAKYMGKEFELVEVTNKSLLSKRKSQKEAEDVLNKEYTYLTKWFNQKLTIDYNGSVSELMHLLLSSGEDIHKKDEGKASLWEKYLYRFNSLKMLQGGMYHLNVDANVKRFHSNLTNLKSELRQYITYDGRQLCSVDVKNCQPFISTVFFNPSFYQSNSGSDQLTLLNLSPIIYNSINKQIPTILSILSTLHITSLIMLVKEKDVDCTSDIELYCTLVDKGRFYNYFSEKYFIKTGTKLDVAIPEEKRMLKDGLFASFFSDNRFMGQPEAEMKRFFAELFPNVYAIFSSIKKGGNKANLPVILQLIESEVVVRRAARQIALNEPEMPLFTIHDSIVVPTEYKEEAKAVLKAKFEQAIGLKPNLAFDIWAGK